MSFGIMKRGKQARQDGGRIGHRPAEESAMQITGRAPHDELHGRDAAQGVGQGGLVARGHRRVRDGREIARQFPAMFPEKLFQIRTADFLLTLDQEDHIHRE